MDNLSPQGAPQEGITPPTETQGAQPNLTTDEQVHSAPVGTPEERVYAGKFKSDKDLEDAYVNLEKKVGSKTFSEKLGERVLSATGYTPVELENAGYTPDQIADMMLQSERAQAQGYQPQQQAAPVQQPARAGLPQTITESIRSGVESSKYKDIQYRLDKQDYFLENPSDKQFESFVDEMRQHPQYKDSSIKDIVERAKQIAKIGEQSVIERHGVKERASMSINTSSAPPSISKEQEALERYQRTGHPDDATAWLRERRKSIKS